MLRMPSLLESRNSLLHLWTSLDWKRIQPTFSPMATGCFLNPALRHQKGATSWCSSRQNWGTETAFLGHNARRRCIKKNFDGIHDRFQRDSVFRDSQLKIGWTEEKCIEMDKLAQEDHSYCPSLEEYERYKKNWYISLNKSGRNAPMKLRSEAVTIMNRPNLENSDLNQSLFINTKGGIRLLLPVPHGGSKMQTGRARSFTVDGNLLQPTEKVNRTPSYVTFSRVCTHV